MRWICLSLVAVATLGRPAAAEGDVPRTVATLKGCHAVLTEQQADLSPQEPGMIRDIKVTEGQFVAKGELLLQLDDSKVQQDLNVAKSKFQAADAKFKAADINVEYARAAKKVADADLEISKGANKEVGRSIPLAKIHEQELKCTETELAITKANSDKSIAEKEANVATAEVAAAEVMVARHKVVSPIAGEVIDVKVHVGETVQPTQPVIRIVNLESLWVQGNVDGSEFARAELEGQDVTVTFSIPPHKEKVSLAGKVIFVKPTTDSDNLYMVRAKVENRKVNNSWLLYPGTFVTMSIQLGKLSLEPTSK